MARQQFDYQPGPCLRSGLCCRTGPCAFGEWDAERHQCRFLEVSLAHPQYTLYSCGKKAEIEALPKSAGADINPAFGHGCCMPLFNDNRRAIAKHHEANLDRDGGKPATHS